MPAYSFGTVDPYGAELASLVKSVIAASTLEAGVAARAATAATTAVVEWGFLVGQAATSTHNKEYVLATVPATESEGITSDDLVDQASQVRAPGRPLAPAAAAAAGR